MLTPTSSDSARAAPLDGALSFSILMQNQRDLTLQYAQSGVSGLLGAIQHAQSDYAPLLLAVQSALEVQENSVERLTSPPWSAASPANLTALTGTLDTLFQHALAALQTQLNAVRTEIATVTNDTIAPSPERTAAADLEDAAALLQTALDQLRGGNSVSAVASLTAARTAAEAARADAAAQLALLGNQNPAPTARLNATQAVIAAADALATAIIASEPFLKSSLAAAHGESAQAFKLTTSTPPDTFLTGWGDSGTISLTDASGRGVMIGADGRVDPLPPAGAGWQFQTDTTFLLTDGTKVTVVPGNPARLLATRGEQQLSIANFASGTPQLVFSSSGGVKADADSNDGTIVTVGAELRAWTMAGSPLGDEAAREVVAVTRLENERLVDVTNVSLPPALVGQLNAFGIDPATYDTNHDGLFNRRELQELTAKLDEIAGNAIIRFDQALARTSSAIEPLVRLNRFLNRIIAEAERRQSQHAQVTAAERDELLAIQREIEAARNALRSNSPDTPAPTNVVAAAKVVLNRIERLGEAEPALSSVAPNRIETPAAPPATEARIAASVPNPPLAQGLRRAQRLLSGFATPATLLTPDIPPPGLGSEPDPALPRATRDYSDREADSTEPSPSELPQTNLRSPASTRTTPGVRDEQSKTAASLPPTETAETTKPTNAPAPVENSREALPPSRATSRANPTADPVGTPGSTGPGAPSVSDVVLPQETVFRSRPTPESDVPALDLRTAVPNPAAVPSDAVALGLRRRLEQHFAVHRDHVARKQEVQTAVRQAVEHFVTLVMNDDQLREAFHADDLSDDEIDAYRNKIQSLERQTGLAWGADPEASPGQDAALQARVLKSGLMI